MHRLPTAQTKPTQREEQPLCDACDSTYIVMQKTDSCAFLSRDTTSEAPKQT